MHAIIQLLLRIMPSSVATGSARPVSGPLSINTRSASRRRRYLGTSQQPLRWTRQNYILMGTLSLMGLFVFGSFAVDIVGFYIESYRIGNSHVERDNQRTQYLKKVQEEREQSEAANARFQAYDPCSFRNYSLHRYYDWVPNYTILNPVSKWWLPRHAEFLMVTDYLFRKWPKMLRDTSPPRKLCIDQSAWRHERKYTRTAAAGSRVEFFTPVSDGTNPSIISRRRLEQYAFNHTAFLWAKFPSAAYLATVTLPVNGQCIWPAAPMNNETMAVNQRRDLFRTILLVLNDSFQRLEEWTIALVPDTTWGRLPTGHRIQETENNCIEACQYTGVSYWHGTTPLMEHVQLFIHNERLWITYRNSSMFNPDAQAINPLHWRGEVGVEIKASETATFCCGRNMALLQHFKRASSEPPLSSSPPLWALTSVDPVTVEQVDTTPLSNRTRSKWQRRRRLQQKASIEFARSNKSPMRGTTGFMVHLPDRREYLGIGHMHRPFSENEGPNQYACGGHHFTHAFFTISDEPPYKLTSLSVEFMLPAAVDNNKTFNAEVIQYWSGLEVVEADEKERMVVIAYGLNACESAITTLPWSKVESVLHPVNDKEDGSADAKQIVDFMAQFAFPHGTG